jgi:acyl-CoA hydrolase
MLSGRSRAIRRIARMSDASSRTVADSQTTLVQLMEITHANIAGIVHGGEVMKLVDTAAGIAAVKHAGGMCVTVSIDEMSFLHPVHVGDLVTVTAGVNDVGTTSLEVGVRVEVEDVMTGERRHTSSAYLVFVALDDEGKPRPVPRLVPKTPAERRRQREAKIRRQMRLAHREAIESHRQTPEADDGGDGAAVPKRPTKEDGAKPAEPDDAESKPKHLRV